MILRFWFALTYLGSFIWCNCSQTSTEKSICIMRRKGNLLIICVCPSVYMSFGIMKH